VTGALVVFVAVVIGSVGGWWAARSAAGRTARRDPADERLLLGERLAQVLVDLTANLDHTEMLHRVARAAAELVGADAAAFAHVEGGASVIRAVHDLPDAMVGFAIGPGEGVMGDVITGGQPVVIADYQTHPHRVATLADAIPHLHTIAGIPSVIDGKVAAAVFVLFRQPDRTLSPTAIDVLRLLASHAGTALANAAMFGEVVRRESHEQAVIEALADGVAVVNPAGEVTSWNSAAAAMTGVTADQAVGRPPPVPVPCPAKRLEHELASDRWLEILTSQLQDTGETVVVLRDISEQKLLERAQSLFLATTTHEIKTPLTVVSGFAATLQKRWNDLAPDDRERALTAIVRRSDALVKLIDQLLLGFRVQAGQLDLDLRGLDLGTTLEAAVAGFDTISEAHTVALEVEEGLPLVICDGRAVDQVLSQLLENAIKYSPEGGPVRVAARRDNGAVRVSVADSGVGLEPGEADRVFSRYFRSANHAETRKVGGVGLGLYIVRQLVEAQGGTVGAAANPDGGTTFEFTLPVAR
jgi:signal transduction histidine kinase